MTHVSAPNFAPTPVQTWAICPDCQSDCPAVVEIGADQVTLRKHCPACGPQEVVLSDDPDWYRKCESAAEQAAQRPVLAACGCGTGKCLPAGAQGKPTGVTLLELTDRCNLTCPTCFTSSSPSSGRHRSMAQIERMLQAIIEDSPAPSVVQLSGGEPTLHPRFFDILDRVLDSPVRHVMINTNGHRLAHNPDFARRLAKRDKAHETGVEVYLKFDSFRASALQHLRGADLRKTRQRAMQHLREAGVSTTLVATLQKGINDDEMGDLVDYALTQPHVRGVTFQPMQAAGRMQGFDADHNRLTLAETRRGLLDQSDLFSAKDIIPLPCHPHAVALGYALKIKGRTIPISRLVNPIGEITADSQTDLPANLPPALKLLAAKLMNSANGFEDVSGDPACLMCNPPRQAGAATTLGYGNLFRLVMVKFADAIDWTAHSTTPIRIATPDGRLVPIDQMNMRQRAGS
ncbi:MAG: radical SAM protein [Alphaproteobacteria bacterium]